MGAATGIEIAATASLAPATGVLYLFDQDGTLPRITAGAVAYGFVLASGPYKTTYDLQSGPNPEQSEVIAPAYRVGFSDRWIRGVTRVEIGGATGVDILDRHQFRYGPGNCTRTEQTFSNGEGAFIVNREGPVRALRGYVHANSGVTTHRSHFFYEEREDIVTVVRVHPIPGGMDLFDYSPAATGMVYRNSLDLEGVTIDGSPDAVSPGDLDWEMVTGPQGTLAITPVATTPDSFFQKECNRLVSHDDLKRGVPTHIVSC